jgi:hypothetical protein
LKQKTVQHKNKKHKYHSVVDLAGDFAGAPYFTGDLAGAPYFTGDLAGAPYFTGELAGAPLPETS